jgi:hypothetical protein
MTERWIETARGLSASHAQTPPGWQVLESHRPPLIDAESVRGIVAALVAVLAWAGSAFRAMVADTPTDPLSLFMRFVAFAMTVRALLLGRELVKRCSVWMRAPGSVLVLAPEGLWGRVLGHEIVASRDDILGVVEHGTWQARSAGRRFSPVYVVLMSGAPTHLELPPIFDATPGVLAERLMRWAGAPELPETPHFPEPAALASKVYEDAARGIRDPRTIVVKHGKGWLRSGPWATVLLALAILESFVRAVDITSDPMSAAVAGSIALVMVLVPWVWIWTTQRAISPRLGLAMVLTPAELLMRVKGGVLRVQWSKLQRLSIDVRGRLSPIEGWALHRTLVIKRKDGAPIFYDEVYLGVPAEVALTLCDAYASGRFSEASEITSSEPS